MTLAQKVALAGGVVYLAIGILGWPVTGFGDLTNDHGDKLLIFDLNPFHNIFHLLVGIYLLLISQLDTAVTEGALIGGGLVFVLAGILGVTNSLQILSMNGAAVGDNALHFVSGFLLLGAGLASSAQTMRSRGAAYG